MNTPYRSLANQALARAKAQLQSADENCYRYASLELRMAIEALTYDRAAAYKDEIPPSEMQTWQPRKLMEVLIEIEPHADKGSTLSFARQKDGEAPGAMRTLGTEQVLGIEVIKKHYDALGSFVHIPSLRQADAAPPFAKMRERCEQIAMHVELTLSSRVYNINFGSFAKMECEGCGAMIRKRLPSDGSSVKAKCPHCNVAEYQLETEPDNSVKWTALAETIPCPTAGCSHQTQIWLSEVKPGAWWKCPSCAAEVKIGLTVFADGTTAKGDTS